MEPYPTYPIGLDYVLNAIPQHHQVRCVDMNELKSGEALAGVVAEYLPDIVGISIRNIDNVDDSRTKTFVEQVEALIGWIRKDWQGVIVLGGSGFTILPAEFMARLDADFGIIGEGERLPALLDALQRKESPADLPGVITRNTPAAFPAPLIGASSRGIIRDHSYRAFYLQKGGILNLQTKRGCPFRCVYCTYPLIEGRRFRFADPVDVARTARMLQDAGAKYLYITDSTFNGSYEHSLGVAKAFQKVGLSIPWGGFFTPTEPPRDYYRTLADAGLMHVEFGTEALSDTTLTHYRKPFTVNDVFASHREVREAGIHVAHYLMLGGPGETETTLQQSLQNATRLEQSVFFVFAGVRIYPHTELFELAVQDGQVDPHANLLEPAFYWSRALQRDQVLKNMEEFAADHPNWIVGAGPPQMFRIMTRMYARGHVGLLWEYLVR